MRRKIDCDPHARCGLSTSPGKYLAAAGRRPTWWAFETGELQRTLSPSITRTMVLTARSLEVEHTATGMSAAIASPATAQEALKKHFHDYSDSYWMQSGREAHFVKDVWPPEATRMQRRQVTPGRRHSTAGGSSGEQSRAQSRAEQRTLLHYPVHLQPARTIVKSSHQRGTRPQQQCCLLDTHERDEGDSL